MSRTPNFADSVVEDYLKVIYSHTEWQPDPITPSVLAGKLGLAASSVTQMVKKLAATGLVTHVLYGAITLTEDGRAIALSMARRHRLIETWLVERFGYGWDEVHDEAEILEHAISDRLLDAIDAQLGSPRRDPHGDPIPGADGSVHQPDATLLFDAPDGFSGVIARISDSDPKLLGYLREQGLILDVPVTVVERKPFGGSLALRASDRDLDLGADAARAIWVTLA